MAVVIRLRRMGHKKVPYFRVVVTDKRFKRDGRFLETVGTYNPLAPDGAETKLVNERIEHWISVGAKPSETVASLMKKCGIQVPGKTVKK